MRKKLISQKSDVSRWKRQRSISQQALIMCMSLCSYANFKVQKCQALVGGYIGKRLMNSLKKKLRAEGKIEIEWKKSHLRLKKADNG